MSRLSRRNASSSLRTAFVCCESSRRSVSSDSASSNAPDPPGACFSGAPASRAFAASMPTRDAILLVSSAESIRSSRSRLAEIAASSLRRAESFIGAPAASAYRCLCALATASSLCIILSNACACRCCFRRSSATRPRTSCPTCACTCLRITSIPRKYSSSRSSASSCCRLRATSASKPDTSTGHRRSGSTYAPASAVDDDSGR